MALEEEHTCEEGSDAAWMATFADLMSLLLTFFVLLLSFANMDVVRFRVVLGSVRDAFGVQFEHPGDMEAVSTSIVELSKQESSPSLKIIDEIMMLEKIQKFIKETKMENLMEASLTERGVVIRIKGHILFPSGGSRLRKEAPDALAPIVKLTKAMPHQLSIEGHTDDRPIKSRKYPSNWELSTARAVATMRYLIDKGLDPKRVNVSGYANMRPIESNASREGRARNRRVEFIFLRSPDKEPITKNEIEAAKAELLRMRAEKTLMDDPGPLVDSSEDDNAQEGSGTDPKLEGEPETEPVKAEELPDTKGSPEPTSDSAATEEISKPDSSASESETSGTPEVKDAEPVNSIAPSLSPGIRASDVSPLPSAATTSVAPTVPATP